MVMAFLAVRIGVGAVVVLDAAGAWLPTSAASGARDEGIDVSEGDGRG